MLYSYNGNKPKINSPAFVAPDATLIGNIEVGKDSVILFGAIIRAENGSIVIGERSIVEDNVIIHGNNIDIGKNVIIQHNSCIHNCKIEDNVVIGTNCTITENVHIENGAMVLNNTIIYPNKKIKSRKKVWNRGNKLRMKRFGGTIDDKIIERNKKHINKVISKMKNYNSSLKEL
ncbi:MAG: gamma carbonic anhydrase family protein [Promethearchaeota archaeon]|nr:MAG: gamma carbonic anhydrase family protein [Candidatus Lokiarchaeota archaeon]